MEYLRLSYSSGNTFESCARKFELDKMYPKRLQKEDAFVADVGSALHAGYQDYLIHQDRDKATWEFLQAYPFRLEFMELNDYRSCEASLATLEEMFDSAKMNDYALANIKLPDGSIRPAIEVPFELRFEGIQLPPSPKYPDGCGIAFIGYIDAILRNLMTDMYRTMDIKTHRDNLQDRTGKYKYDSQQIPYGIIVDHIAGEPVDQFEVLYLDCKIDIVEPKVKLYPFLKNQEDLQEWLLTRVMQFQQMQRYAQMNHWPRTSGGCMFYNRPCRYLDPCVSRDPAVLENWFLMGDEAGPEREWNPWIVTTINPFGEA